MRVISTGGNRRRSATEGLAKGVDTPTRQSRFRDASQKKCAELTGPTRSAERRARLAIIEGALFAKGSKEWRNAMLVRGAAGSIAVILLTRSAALAANAPPGDASAPSQEGQGVTQAQAAPVVSAPDVSLGGPVVLPVLSALPADYFATTPHLLGEWPGIRSKLSDLGIIVSITGVDEAVMNLSGGDRRIAQEAGQVAFQAEFDLQKRLGLKGTSLLVTLVNRWGRDAATDA